jgi:hypothetical protein
MNGTDPTYSINGKEYTRSQLLSSSGGWTEEGIDALLKEGKISLVGEKKNQDDTGGQVGDSDPLSTESDSLPPVTEDVEPDEITELPFNSPYRHVWSDASSHPYDQSENPLAVQDEIRMLPKKISKNKVNTINTAMNLKNPGQIDQGSADILTDMLGGDSGSGSRNLPVKYYDEEGNLLVERKTSDELLDNRISPVLDQETKFKDLIDDRKINTPAINDIIRGGFSGFELDEDGEDVVREYLAETMNAVSLEKKAQQISMNWGEKQRYELVTNATQHKFNKIAKDREILFDRGDIEGAYNKDQELDKVIGAYEEQVKHYPEIMEVLREKEEKSQALAIVHESPFTEEDPLKTKAAKQLKASAATVKNSIIDAGVSLIHLSKLGSDMIQRRAFGKNISGYDPSDRWMENMSDFVEFNMKASELNQRIFNEGDFNAEAVLPNTMRALSDMAILLIGGRTLFAKATGSYNKGLVLSSFAMTHPMYYNDAINRGLTDQEGQDYANHLSAIIALTELASPNKNIWKNNILKDAGIDLNLEAWTMAAKNTKRRAATNQLLYEPFKEIGQELLQLGEEKAAAWATNEALGKDALDTSIDSDEIKDLMLVTYLSTFILNTPRTVTEINSLKITRRKALEMLNERRNDFYGYIMNQYSEGKITADQADKAVRELSELIEETRKQLIFLLLKILLLLMFRMWCLLLTTLLLSRRWVTLKGFLLLIIMQHLLKKLLWQISRFMA